MEKNKITLDKNLLNISGRISRLQENIFCSFFEMHYLKIFEEFIELDVIGFNPVQEIYYAILSQRDLILDNKNQFERIGCIIFSKIEKVDSLNYSYLHSDEDKKYQELGLLLFENRTIIFPKKSIVSLTN